MRWRRRVNCRKDGHGQECGSRKSDAATKRLRLARERHREVAKFYDKDEEVNKALGELKRVLCVRPRRATCSLSCCTRDTTENCRKYVNAALAICGAGATVGASGTRRLLNGLAMKTGPVEVQEWETTQKSAQVCCAPWMMRAIFS